ncbi:MAG: ATP-binding protein [Candidatus Diapherotrites archaeon]
MDTANQFTRVGTETSKIEVRISYRIIDLFSNGLYKSPNKAIEELVSNSFDAGATTTHVILSPEDLKSGDNAIAVIDNGIGMDKQGLEEHWQIGVSRKRDDNYPAPKGRKQIGRFGIGKLATYVLANELTHVTKVGKKYFATTMNYGAIPEGDNGGIHTDEKVELPLRELTESEAKMALERFIGGTKFKKTGAKLFGPDAEETWTVAILSNLKKMAEDLKIGRLRWVLETAMPLRDDFKLYLNGLIVEPSKIKEKRIGKWIIGKDIVEVPSPATDNLKLSEDRSVKKDSELRYGLESESFGRVTGYVELYDDLLTKGKNVEIFRSHGFFVYVRDRLINIDDEYFGISSNSLRHGTFNRFRAILHIDELDDVLRSSRESVSEGPLYEAVRNLLAGLFNFVQKKQKEIEEKLETSTQASARLASAPDSLTKKPILYLLDLALSGKYLPRYFIIPKKLSESEKKSFLEEFKNLGSDKFIEKIEKIEELTESDKLAQLDMGTKTLRINILHPFVSHFIDEYNRSAKNQALELFAIAEVLLECQLLEFGHQPTVVSDILGERDELLRNLGRSTPRRNALLVSQALLDSVTNEHQFEEELAAAFDSLGFYDAIRVGGKGNPDGIAKAYLSADEKGGEKAYFVTLEAKSKKHKGKISKDRVDIATIALHRKKYKANFAVVVGPEFPTTRGEKSTLSQLIKEDREKNPGKGITLIKHADLAKLVRLSPGKITLDKLRELFEKCSLPEESKAWIDKACEEDIKKAPYKEILKAIEVEQRDAPYQPVEYGSICTALRKDFKIDLKKNEVIDLCKALSRMAPTCIFARENSVELNVRSDKILSAISSVVAQYPDEEQDKMKKLGNV